MTIGNGRQPFPTAELDLRTIRNSCETLGSGGIVTPDAGKTLSVNTRIFNTNDELQQAPVTPDGDDRGTSVADSSEQEESLEASEILVASLSESIQKSFSWKPNKKSNESTSPHPLKSHLLTAYNETSLKEILCCVFPNLKKLLLNKNLRDYPDCMRLFLFGICSIISGLPNNYRVEDPWDLVATSWCRQCTGGEMEDACTKVIKDFLCKCPRVNLEENNDTTNRVLTFVEQSRWSLYWKPDSIRDPLPTYLKETYKKSDPFFRYIFEDKPPPSTWDINTKAFLFAMRALTSRTTTAPFIPETVAGFTKKELWRFEASELLNAIDTDQSINADTALTEAESSEGHEESLSPEEMMHREDEYIVEILQKRLAMQKSSRSLTINQLLHKITSQVLDESKTSQYISTVSYQSKKNQKIEKNFIFLPQSQSDKEYTDLKRSSKRKKISRLKAVFDAVVGSDAEQQEELLIEFSKSYPNIVVMRTVDFKWSDSQLGLILNILGSANMVAELDKLERGLKGNTRYPSQVQKKLRMLASIDSLAIKSEMVELEMNSTKEVKPQLFWHITEPFQVLERLVEATFQSSKFLHSSEFSKFSDSLVFPFGCDKDVMATSMLLRLANRANGNSNDYVATLALYEKAAECYENLSKTILKEGSATQTFLQLLLDNKIFVLTVNLVDNDGKIIDSQSRGFNLFANHCQSDSDNRMLEEMNVTLQRVGDVQCMKNDFKVTSSEDLENLNLNLKNSDGDNDGEIETLLSGVYEVDNVSSFPENNEDASDVDDTSESSDNGSEEDPSPSVPNEETDNCIDNHDDDELSATATEDGNEDENDRCHDGSGEENASRGQEDPTSLGMKCIGLELDDDWKNGSKCLWLQLVFDGDKYFGYRIFLKNPNEGGEDALLVAGLFDKPIQRKPAFGFIDCHFQQAMGFVSCDKKNSWATMGMMESSNSRSNCICCTQPQSTYKTNCPDWMVEYAQDNAIENKRLTAKVKKKLKDCPLRCGEHSNSVMNKALQKEINDGDNTFSEDELRAIREKHGCAVNKPLLEIHPSKQTFGTLHNGAGLENHFKNNMDARMAEIDSKKIRGSSTWKDEVEKARKRCRTILAENTFLKGLKTESTRIHRDIQCARLNIDRAMNPKTRLKSVTDDYLEKECGRLDHLLACKDQIDSEYGWRLRRHKGADALLKLIESYLASKKPKGPAQWAFRKAIELNGSRFNPQHGGMDLSHAHGLKMLEKWDMIVDMVSNIYDSGPRREMVKKAMEESKEIAGPLFNMNKLLKSQRKWNDAMIEDLKYNCYHMFFNWLELFPKQGVFPKLHDAAWHIPAFIVEHGMYGILSEESFESRHIVHKKLALILQSMPNMKLRSEVFAKRLQFFQRPDFEKVKAELETKTRGKKRGPYKKKPKENSLPFSAFEMMRDGDLIRIDKNMSIESDLLDVYNMCARGIVPSSWHQIFSGRNDIDSTKKEATKYSSQVL